MLERVWWKGWGGKGGVRKCVLERVGWKGWGGKGGVERVGWNMLRGELIDWVDRMR